MTKLLLDSWAFLEVFENGPKALQVRDFVVGCEKYTTTLNVYEVFYRLKQDKGIDKAAEAVKIIADNSIVLQVSIDLAVSAAVIRDELKQKSKNFSAVDIITYAAAQSVGATLVTGDPDFKGVKGVKLF
ncbi:MAG: PIN domain-containing protein [Candidatus Micrarchaeota archaeon]